MHRSLLGVSVLAVVALGMSTWAIAQKGPKERASTVGDHYRAVIVQPVLSAASRFVDRDIDYSDTPKMAAVLKQLETEGYEPVQIEALNEDSVMILARKLEGG